MISRHRLLRPAERALERYINARKAKHDRLMIFSIWAQRSLGYSRKHGGHLVPVRFSVTEDENGREKDRPYAMIVKVVKG